MVVRQWLFWLENLLPTELPGARIFSFGHDSRWSGAENPLTEDVSDHGEALVLALTNKRQLTNVSKAAESQVHMIAC